MVRLPKVELSGDDAPQIFALKFEPKRKFSPKMCGVILEKDESKVDSRNVMVRRQGISKLLSGGSGRIGSIAEITGILAVFEGKACVLLPNSR